MTEKDIQFLKNIEPPLDDQQQEVCCTAENAVVAAGAGSGKTQVLATRFAWLVATGRAKASEVLTLTFTNKAAAEMYTRIYSILAGLAGDRGTFLDTEQKTAVQAALADFSNTHIQTLDSYCSFIVHQAANSYGIRPDFSVGSSGGKRAVKDLAFSFVLQHRSDPALQAITEPAKLRDTADNVFAEAVIKYTSIASPDTFFTGRFDEQCGKIADAWNALVDKVEETRSSVDAVLKQLDAREAAGAFAAGVKDCVSSLPAEFKISAADVRGGAVHSRMEQYIDQVSSSRKKFNFRGAVPEIEDALAPFVKRNDDVKRKIIFELTDMFRPVLLFVSRADAIRQIYVLLDEFLRQVNTSKRRTGQLTFADVPELALEILRTNEDVRRQEQNAYKYVMIDEFQDNNGRNREMLDIIGCPAFYVGDEKQSIYKFRGADVSVFNQLKLDMERGRGRVLKMVYNYRSNRQLLNSFNQIFGGYMPGGTKVHSAENSAEEPEHWIFPEKDGGNTYKACFTGETVAKKNPALPPEKTEFVPLASEKVPVHVVMYNKACIKNLPQTSEDGRPLTEDDFLDEKNALPYFIAREIRRLNTCGVPFSDIAVLDKSRTNRASLLEALSREEIPYTLDQHKDLFAEAPVNDVYTFLRLCLYPFDTNSYAAVLRSPFCGLSEQSTEAVLSAAVKERPEGVYEQPEVIPFGDADDAAVKVQVSAAEYTRYAAGKALYTQFAHDALCRPLTETITKLWYETGYRYETLWNTTVSVFAEQYDLLFELARRADAEGRTAAWFVDQLAEKKSAAGQSFGGDDSDIGTDDVDYPLEENDAVRIMTIHKSKGLEFPYVFVCGCTGKVKTETNREKIYYTEQDGLSVRFRSGEENYFFTKLQEEETKKKDAEFRRIFYVALTRAEKQAYIVGSWERPYSGAAEPSLMEKMISCYYPEACSSVTFAQNAAEYTESAPFDFRSFAPVEKGSLYAVPQTANSADTKIRRIELFAPKYSAAETLMTPVVAEPRFSPSSLEPQNMAAAGEDSAHKQLDAAINSTRHVKHGPDGAEEKTIFDFGYNDFGTLAHLYMQMNAAGSDAAAFVPPDNLTARLSAANKKIVTDACIEMVRVFNESEQGKDFADCRTRGGWFRAEYAFKSFVAGMIESGSLDLVYQKAGGSYAVVDYKTDSSIHPEKYYAQLACYRKAASEMLHVPQDTVSCTLFYLRFGRAVDITEQTAQITEENIRTVLEQNRADI